MNHTTTDNPPIAKKNSCRFARRRGCLLPVLATLALSVTARAVVLIQTPGPLEDSITRPNPPYFAPGGHVGQIVVGGQSVQINGIGVLGQSVVPTQISWVIFADVDHSSPVYQSAPVSYSAAGGAQWYDSPTFSIPFTLQANSIYWVGLAVSSPDNSFRFFINDTFPQSAPTVTANGLTIPGSPFPWAANLGGSFAAPVIELGTSTVQVGMRLHGVPEPASSAFLLAGTCVVLRRRRRD